MCKTCTERVKKQKIQKKCPRLSPYIVVVINAKILEVANIHVHKGKQKGSNYIKTHRKVKIDAILHTSAKSANPFFSLNE